jgi:hypothetical protein
MKAVQHEKCAPRKVKLHPPTTATTTTVSLLSKLLRTPGQVESQLAAGICEFDFFLTKKFTQLSVELPFFRNKFDR